MVSQKVGVKKYKKNIISITKLQRVSAFIITFAILSLGSYLFSNFQTSDTQISYSETENLDNYIGQKIDIANEAVAGASTNTEKFVATADRIEIPKLNVIGNVTYPDDEKWVDGLLNKSIVHLPQTVTPGHSGMTVFSAHSSSSKNSYYSKIFSTLNKLRSGDIIMLYQKNNVIIYKVYKQEIIEPRLENLKSEKSEELVLTTCWPLGTDEKRLVIYAERLK